MLFREAIISQERRRDLLAEAAHQRLLREARQQQQQQQQQQQGRFPALLCWTGSHLIQLGVYLQERAGSSAPATLPAEAAIVCR